MEKNIQGTTTSKIDGLVSNALLALESFYALSQEQVDYIIAKVSVAALEAHGTLALDAVNETKRGVFEDKATKNLFAVEYVVNHIRHMKTVGVISEDEVSGITTIADPVGVLCGIVPVTNPTSTTLFKCIIALKTRNPIIFSFHPAAINCSIKAAKVVYDAAVEAGAPKNCIQWIDKSSMEATQELMNHDGVSLILATGGNAMVKSAYSCGKPALGVGAGNVPAYIHQSANLKQAVNDVVMSKSFDNGMVCASEQGCFIDHDIYKDAIDRFKQFGTYMLSEDEKLKLMQYAFGVSSYKDGHQAKLNADIVGKSAVELAKKVGIKVPSNTTILGVKCKEVGETEPFSREKLSPILAFYDVKDDIEGILKAKQMVEFNGLGHSACIHANDDEIVKRFGIAMKAIRIIHNSPTTFGGIGQVYNQFIPSLTLGCGSYGRNSVGDNVSASHLLNFKKIGRRKNNMQWFKIPSKIYFERDSVEYLRQMRDVNKVFIVTDRMMVDLGYIKKVTDQLNLRRNHVSVQLFCDVEPDPSIDTVKKGYEIMRSFEPDTIIAIGGGSPMDAAKAMWLFYEHPEVNFNDLKQKFMDIRKRAFRYPELGKKSSLVCIPTTSGTGSEVTPFAVITDKQENKKYPLADYSLTPTVAIVDPAFTMTQPKSVTADTGMDVLTHAIESYVSTLANDYTDALSLSAIEMVFKYLKQAVDHGDDFEAREKMHNASTMAGMAFGNAFLGICHSMAHKIGGKFHVPHGRINAILLPEVIRYNGQKPSKLATWPKYNYYQADEKYQKIARMLGLKASTPEEGVESLAQAVYNLGQSVGIQMTFKAQKVDEKAYMDALDELAYMAYEDQCSPANPRLPLVKEMKAIMKKVYQ